jgi:trehalose synthase
MDLQPMAIAPRAPGEYAPAAGARAIERLAGAAEPLRGARVLHVSSAGAGGRLPEQLGALLSLAAGSGIETEWRVLFGEPDDNAVAGALEAGLRGSESAIAPAQREAWLESCRRAGRGLGDGVGLVVLHDAALGLAAGIEDVPVVWRSHRDLSRAEPDALAVAAPLIERCALVLVPDPSLAPTGPAASRLAVAAPGIDPLDSRNLDVEPRLPGRVVRRLGIDLDRPFCLQVLDLDRWDDPHSAIEIWRRAREQRPELQLVLAALLDESAGWHGAKEVSDYVAGSEGVFLVTSYEGLGGLELGALGLLARVVIERSLSEGFDLAPCEALWKRTPVVGGRTGGLPLMVRDGVDGFLSDDLEELARHLVALVEDPGLAAEMGRAGREHVREHLLVTAALERELRALAGVTATGTVETR